MRYDKLRKVNETRNLLTRFGFSYSPGPSPDSISLEQESKLQPIRKRVKQAQPS
ncbi:unnamed protein product [Arabidopsis halleri]